MSVVHELLWHVTFLDLTITNIVISIAIDTILLFVYV